MSENIVQNRLEEVKLKNSLLIIVISNEGAYREVFNSANVKSRISEMNGVTLEISTNSREYENFRQIYLVGTPPLICFISADGIVLDVVKGEISQELFLKVLNFSFENLNRGDQNQGYYPLNALLKLPTPDNKAIGEELTVKSPQKSPTVPISADNLVTHPIESKELPKKQTSNLCRLKFSLPNGSQVSHSFEAGTTLEELKLFLQTHLPNSKGLVIIRPHPRMEFQSDQDKLTLQQLDIQSGTGLFVREKINEVKSTFSIIWRFVTAIYSLLISLYAYFFSTRNYSTPQQPADRAQANLTQAEISPSKTSEENRGITAHAKNNTSTRAVNRRHNMYRLTDLEDKEDDNNTYNGNSTQQQ